MNNSVKFRAIRGSRDVVLVLSAESVIFAPAMEQNLKMPFEIHPVSVDGVVSVPFVEDALVHAGFPVPVDDAYQSQPINLNDVLIRNPSTMFIMRVVGDSMVEEGIDSGDLLVIDRSLFPTEKNIAVVALDGEFALKRIVHRGGRLLLLSGNSDYPPIEVHEGSELRTFGVVLWVLKKK